MSSSDTGVARARYTIPNCAAQRARKGVTKKALATAAKLDASTVNKIERRVGIKIETDLTGEPARSVIHGLCKKYLD